MKTTLALLIALLLLPTFGIGQDADPKWSETEFREWTDSTGEFQVKAKLIDVPPGEGVVVLQKENGETLRVPTDRLSTRCKRYLDRLSKPKAQLSKPKTFSRVDHKKVYEYYSLDADNRSAFGEYDGPGQDDHMPVTRFSVDEVIGSMPLSSLAGVSDDDVVLDALASLDPLPLVIQGKKPLNKKQTDLVKFLNQLSAQARTFLEAADYGEFDAGNFDEQIIKAKRAKLVSEYKAFRELVFTYILTNSKRDVHFWSVDTQFFIECTDQIRQSLNANTRTRSAESGFGELTKGDPKFPDYGETGFRYVEPGSLGSWSGGDVGPGIGHVHNGLFSAPPWDEGVRLPLIRSSLTPAPKEWTNLKTTAVVAVVYDSSSARVTMENGQEILIRGLDLTNIANGEQVDLDWMVDMGTMQISEFHQKYKIVVDNKASNEDAGRFRVYQTPPDPDYKMTRQKVSDALSGETFLVNFEMLSYDLKMKDGTLNKGIFKTYESGKFHFLNKDMEPFTVKKIDVDDVTAASLVLLQEVYSFTWLPEEDEDMFGDGPGR